MLYSREVRNTPSFQLIIFALFFDYKVKSMRIKEIKSGTGWLLDRDICDKDQGMECMKVPLPLPIVNPPMHARFYVASAEKPASQRRLWSARTKWFREKDNGTTKHLTRFEFNEIGESAGGRERENGSYKDEQKGDSIVTITPTFWL